MPKKGSSKVKVGDTFDTKTSGKIEVVSIDTCKKIKVKFLETGYETITTSSNLLNEVNIKDPYLPRICGVGFMGVGPIKALKGSKHRNVWEGMLRRCNDPAIWETHPRYKECYVCDEWLNLQNFSKWYLGQEAPSDYQLDKDIVVSHNKVYSPNTCLLVPRSINMLLNANPSKYKNMLIGARLNPSGRYRAEINIGSSYKFLGIFDTELEAHLAYLKAKAVYVREVAIEQEPFLRSCLERIAGEIERGEYYV